MQDRAQALANWLAAMPELRRPALPISRSCARENRIAELRIEAANGVADSCAARRRPAASCSRRARLSGDRERCCCGSRAARRSRGQSRTRSSGYVSEYNQLAAQQKNIRNLYLLFLLLIALFILFVATWIALLLSRQISVPISALLEAAERGPQGQPGLSRAGEARSTNWPRWCAPSTK